MITGAIQEYGKYTHLETGKVVQVRDANCQAKLAACWDGAGTWTTCVAYVPEDSNHAMFVVDVDSFRRKFVLVEE